MNTQTNTLLRLTATSPNLGEEFGITPHGKGLGGGASVRTLPGAVKERMFERSEFLAPAANGFVRIAQETQPLIFFFVTFFLHQGKKESECYHGHGTPCPYNPT